MIDEGVPLITDEIVLEMNRKKFNKPVNFMGVRGYVPISEQIPVGESTGIDMPGEIWRRFHKVKSQIHRKPDGLELGVAYMGDAPEGCFTYFAGTEVEAGTMDEHFQTWQLPAREYVVCGFEAENFLELTTVALNKAIRYSGLWLEKHNLIMDMFAPEIYYSSTPETTYMEYLMPLNNI